MVKIVVRIPINYGWTLESICSFLERQLELEHNFTSNGWVINPSTLTDSFHDDEMDDDVLGCLEYHWTKGEKAVIEGIAMRRESIDTNGACPKTVQETLTNTLNASLAQPRRAFKPREISSDQQPSDTGSTEPTSDASKCGVILSPLSSDQTLRQSPPPFDHTSSTTQQTSPAVRGHGGVGPRSMDLIGLGNVETSTPTHASNLVANQVDPSISRYGHDKLPYCGGRDRVARAPVNESFQRMLDVIKAADKPASTAATPDIPSDGGNRDSTSASHNNDCTSTHANQNDYIRGSPPYESGSEDNHSKRNHAVSQLVYGTGWELRARSVGPSQSPLGYSRHDELRGRTSVQGSLSTDASQQGSPPRYQGYNAASTWRHDRDRRAARGFGQNLQHDQGRYTRPEFGSGRGSSRNRGRDHSHQPSWGENSHRFAERTTNDNNNPDLLSRRTVVYMDNRHPGYNNDGNRNNSNTNNGGSVVEGTGRVEERTTIQDNAQQDGAQQWEEEKARAPVAWKEKQQW